MRTPEQGESPTHVRRREHVARRWMSVITEDLPDYEFTQGWSGTCNGQSFENLRRGVDGRPADLFGSHWRTPVLDGEVMMSYGGGGRAELDHGSVPGRPGLRRRWLSS